MKKFLSLVLALVMAMSLVTVSAGAAGFSDKSDIDYSEAIDVMNAVGVVSGYSDGTFRPDAVLTRGAASKIICNMLLGSTSADALSVNSAPFSDVAADSTFAGYIAYMVKEGIVSGYSDGTFRPGANLTGYAFMKMLLTALGYDAQSEGYVGANWSVAVAKRALSIGLDDGLEDTFNGLRPVTRQEACLYALNTLKADMVDYAQNFTVTTGNGVEIKSAAKAEPVTSSTLSSRNNIKGRNDDDDNIVQLGEKVFTKLSLYTDSTDDFGHPCNEWTLSAKTIGKYAKTPAVVFNKNTSDSKVVKAMSGIKVLVNNALDFKKVDDVTTGYDYIIADCIYENGEKQTQTFGTGTNAVSLSVIAISGGDTIADTIAEWTEDNNTLVEIYTNDDNYVDWIVKTEFEVGKVTRVSTDSKGTTTYRVEAKFDGTNATGKTYAADSANDDTIVLASAVKVDDIVTYAVLDGITYVYPTTKVSGTVSKVSKKADEITMGGTTYDMNTANNKISAASKADLYVDYLGRVAWADGAGDSSIYYLASAWKQTVKGTPHYYAQLVSLSGVVEEIAITKDAYEGWLDGDGDFDTIYRGAYVKGTEDTESRYTPEVAGWAFECHEFDNDTMKVTRKVFPKTNPDDSVTNYYVNDDVKLLYVKDGGEDLKVSVVEGMQRVKDATMFIIVDKNEPHGITNIIVMGKPSQAADKLLFMAEDDLGVGTATDNEGKKADTQKLYLDGESDIYMLKNKKSDAGFYEYSIDETTGRYDLSFCTDNVAIAYIAGTGESNTVASKRYIQMYEITKDAYGKADIGDYVRDENGAAYDAKNATFYDLTDYNITSVSALYDVKTNEAGASLLLFAVYDDDKETINTVYVIKARKATAWRNLILAAG